MTHRGTPSPDSHIYTEHAGCPPHGHCVYCGASYEAHALAGTESARTLTTGQRCDWCEGSGDRR